MKDCIDKNLIIHNTIAVHEEGQKAALFVLNPDGELNMKSYQPSSGWSGLHKISEGIKCFTAASGTHRNLYLVETDGEGSFFLKKREGSGWESTVFFREEREKQIRNLQLLADHGECLHLIYLLSSLSGEQWWLIHHFYSGGKWDDPRVIDFGGDGNHNYSHAFTDKNDILHIAYHVKERNRIPLYHRTFSKQDANWSRAVTINAEHNNFFPLLFEGADLNLHIAWCSANENSCLIRHSKKVQTGWPGGEKWMPATDISPPLKEQAFPYIDFNDDLLNINWISSGCTYRRHSLDGGNHWDNIEITEHSGRIKLLRLIAPAVRDRLPRLHWIATPGTDNSSVELSVQLQTEINDTKYKPPLQERQKLPAGRLPDAPARAKQRQNMRKGRTPPAPSFPGRGGKDDGRKKVWSYQHHRGGNKPNVHYKKEQTAGQHEKKDSRTENIKTENHNQSHRLQEKDNLNLLKENQMLKEEKTTLIQQLDEKNNALKRLRRQQVYKTKGKETTYNNNTWKP